MPQPNSYWVGVQQLINVGTTGSKQAKIKQGFSKATAAEVEEQ